MEARWGYGSVKCVTRIGVFLVRVSLTKEPKFYVGRWLGGFEWPIFVGVDGFTYGKTGS